MPIARKSIAEVFAALRARGQIALMPFVAAGYPSIHSTPEVLLALQDAGADLIEIGIPFSDPIADGPVIQEAYTQALAAGVKVGDVLQTVRSVRDRLAIPLVAMVSYSIVFRTGVKKFAGQLESSGFDALLIPDLPPPEAEDVCKVIQDEGLATVLLLSPNTNEHRRQAIARLSSGFIYHLSVQGITGERESLPLELAGSIQSLRKLTDRPIAVGFGVSKPSHVKQLQGVADGAIVGTALVRRLAATVGRPPAEAAAAAGAFCRELLSEVR